MDFNKIEQDVINWWDEIHLKDTIMENNKNSSVYYEDNIKINNTNQTINHEQHYGC